MTTHKRGLAALLAVSAFALGGTAVAVPISGDIGIGGDVTPTGGATLGAASGLSFPGNDFEVLSSSGDFLANGVADGDIGTIFDFDFAPLNPSPVDPLWTIGIFEFDLLDITIDLQTDALLLLSGTGVLQAAGFDDTMGNWTLSANNQGLEFTFSSSAAANPTVSEPGILLLLSAGIISLALTRRRRRG